MSHVILYHLKVWKYVESPILIVQGPINIPVSIHYELAASEETVCDRERERLHYSRVALWKNTEKTQISLNRIQNTFFKRAFHCMS